MPKEFISRRLKGIEISFGFYQKPEQVVLQSRFALLKGHNEIIVSNVGLDPIKSELLKSEY